jgi:hypothetical protein
MITLHGVGLVWMSDQPDLYLPTHNTYKRQTSMPLAGFKPTVSASEWPQTHTLDRAATGICTYDCGELKYLTGIFFM